MAITFNKNRANVKFGGQIGFYIFAENEYPTQVILTQQKERRSVGDFSIDEYDESANQVILDFKDSSKSIDIFIEMLENLKLLQTEYKMEKEM